MEIDRDHIFYLTNDPDAGEHSVSLTEWVYDFIKTNDLRIIDNFNKEYEIHKRTRIPNRIEILIVKIILSDIKLYASGNPDSLIQLKMML